MKIHSHHFLTMKTPLLVESFLGANPLPFSVPEGKDVTCRLLGLIKMCIHKQLAVLVIPFLIIEAAVLNVLQKTPMKYGCF